MTVVVIWIESENELTTKTEIETDNNLVENVKE
jgi:hypothetical protein